MLRLRQVVTVAQDLRAVETELADQLGLEVCYRDPGLAGFGLRHGLYPIGDRLLEVVVPKRPGTTAGRFLDRRGGDGGYMIIVQTDDLERERARVDGAGIRVVFDASEAGHGESIKGIHLHPRDVGGAIVSIDQADPPESWSWAGHDWAYHARDEVVNDIVAVEVQADDAQAMADRWAMALGRPAEAGTAGPTIALDDAEIRFVAATDGRGDGVAAFDLVATDRSRAGQVLAISGVDFHLV